jgi:hypothetical protein
MPQKNGKCWDPEDSPLSLEKNSEDMGSELYNLPKIRMQDELYEGPHEFKGT